MPESVAVAEKRDFARELASDRALAMSYALCQRIAKRRARNFYYGLRLTPEPHRSALYTLYAFMRTCDDLADGAMAQGQDAEGQIELLRQRMRQVVEEDHLPQEGVEPSLWPAFRQVVRRFDLPAGYLHAMLDGQKADLHKTRYANFQELYGYCYNVAGVVGLAAVSIWGYEGGEATRRMAEHRGIALQLTNILRDLCEDADRDRLYLPLDELAQGGWDPQGLLEDLRGRRERAGLGELLRAQARRARGYYESSADLERQVAAVGRPACWAIGRIYEGLLRKIERDPCRVLRRRVRLHSLHKAAIAVRAVWQRG